MDANQGLDELASIIRSQKPRFRIAFFLSFVGGLMLLAPMAYMFEVYGRVVESRSLFTLGMLFVLLVWSLAVMETLDWFRARILRLAGHAIDHALQEKLFHVVARLSLLRGYPFHHQAVGDVRNLREIVSGPAMGAIAELPVALVFLSLMCVIHPAMGALALLAVVIQFAMGYAYQQLVSRASLQAQKLTYRSQGLADAMLANLSVIAGMGMFASVHDRWIKLYKQSTLASLDANLFGSGLSVASRILQLLVGSAVLGLGVWFLLHEQITGGAGVIIVASTLGGRILAPFSQLMLQGRSVILARDAYRRLGDALARNPLPNPTMPLPAPVGRVSVEALTAGPPGYPNAVIRNINFELKQGELLVVTGSSGSGKSTLAKLLLGLWPAQAGRVRLDRVDMATWPKHQVGPWLGYLPQKIELAQATVMQNLTRFASKEQADRVQAMALLSELGLEACVRDLPHGSDTELGRGGSPLSIGQRQRLGIARAFYGEPRLVLLDEPSSYLDEQGERELVKFLSKQKSRGCTMVIVTHRRVLVDLADQVLVLDQGQQRFFGPRDEAFARMGGAS
jgi:ATP-binding cassette, subfamily C, bacterial exporter for protease/lipase